MQNIKSSDLAVQIVDGKSILSYTLSLPLGAQRKIYIGGNVTDLPGDYCKYSEAVVCKLNNTFAQIVIHPRNSGPMECTNTFNGTTWEGWRFGLSNNDIDGRLFFSASGTTAIESFDNASNRYRLQVGTAGTVRLYHSSDGGKTWANFKEIAFTS